ncbi:MAG: peptidylprolyl isomerase [Bacteroidota bacterium]
MIYKIFIFILFSFTIFGQITKKQLDEMPTVAEVVQQEPLVVSIGKKSFTLKDFTQLYKRSIQTDSLPEKTPKQFLDNFIKVQLKVAKAEKDGLDTTMAFREEIATIKKELTDAFMVEKTVTDALIKEAFERLETEVNVSHIILALDPYASPDDTLIVYNKLNEIRSQIVNGEKFNEMALKYSTDGSVKKDEGNLGYITAFQTLYPFESACYKTPVGKISMPFRTAFGYHIVKVIAKREYQRWKAAHIFVAVGANSSESDQANAKKKIDDIYKQLQGGENFEKLAQISSEDITTNSKGGIFKRLFGTDELEKPFEDALFSIKKNGAYAAPIRTSKGWHIVRLIEREELKPFNEMFNYLQNKVAADSRSEIAKNALLQRIKKENSFKQYQSVIDDCISLIDSLLSEKKSLKNVKNDVLTKPIFSIGQSEIPAKKFIDFANLKFENTKKYYHKIMVEGWYSEFEMDENIRYEEEVLSDKNQEFRQLMEEYREGILMQNIESDQLINNIVQDTTAQKNYFGANKMQYMIADRMTAQIYDASSIANLKKAREIFLKSPYPISLKWNDLLFEKNLAEINEDHKRHLTDLALMALKNHDFIIEISGNIDPEEAESVSSERAANVVKFMNNFGIPMEKIVEKDNGKFQPLSKTEREKNRRVSFKIFSNNKQDVVKIYNALKPESLKVFEGSYKKGENKTVDLLRWEAGEQEIEKGGRFIFANITNIEPARTMTFSEAKGKVVKAMLIAKENEMIEKLKEAFPVIVNEDQLKKVVK